MREVTCHRGHTTIAALWDCPVCVGKEREAAGRMRESLTAIQSWADDSYQCRHENYHVDDLVACIVRLHNMARDSGKAYDEARKDPDA